MDAALENSYLMLSANYLISSLIQPQSSLHLVDRDVAHVGDAEGLVLELAVAGAEDRVVLLLDGRDHVGRR